MSLIHCANMKIELLNYRIRISVACSVCFKFILYGRIKMVDILVLC